MNGIEHYQEAERLLAVARSEHGALNVAELAVLVAEAQVHATLALAAASALTATHRYVGDSQEITDWARIVQPAALTRKVCADGCEDGGRNGCHRPCLEAQAARNASTEEMECPF